MHNVGLAAVVLLSGMVGLFLLSLAEKRVMEVTGAWVPAPEEGADLTENEPPDGSEEKGSSPGTVWSNYLFIGGMLLCGAAMAVFLDKFYGESMLSIANVLLVYSVLWPCAWSDGQAKVIPNRVLLFGLLLRVGVLAYEMVFYPQDILIDLARGTVAATALCLVTLLCRLIVPRAIGFGDIKLLMLMGFCLGTDRAWSSIFCTMVVSFFYSLFLLLTKRANMKTEIPYAPLLLTGTVLATFLISV